MPNKPKSEAQGIQLSYRYRIYPTPEQEKALAFEFDACRYVYNHFLRARTESWERTQKTLRRPKLAPGADPNAKHPEYVKDSNGKTVWEEYVNESYDPEAKSMGSIPSKMLTALKNSCLDEDGNLWLKQADKEALPFQGHRAKPQGHSSNAAELCICCSCAYLPDCAGCNLGIVSNRCKSRSCVDCT